MTMVKLEVWFEEHHIGSAGSMARIIQADWPAMKVVITNGSDSREYAQGDPDTNKKITHSCTHCNNALFGFIHGETAKQIVPNQLIEG